MLIPYARFKRAKVCKKIILFQTSKSSPIRGIGAWSAAESAEARDGADVTPERDAKTMPAVPGMSVVHWILRIFHSL